MRHLIFFIFFGLVTNHLNSQKFGVGLMGGFNSSLNSFKSQSEFIKSFDSKLGYNTNIFLSVRFSGFLIQPEFGYYNNRISIAGTKDGLPLNVDISTGDIYSTILVGYTFSHFRFMVGPISYYTSNVIYEKPKGDIESVLNANTNNMKFGLQAGIGFDISPHWRIDGRIQRTFSTSAFKVEYQDNQNESISGSLGSLSLSIGYNFFRNF